MRRTDLKIPRGALASLVAIALISALVPVMAVPARAQTTYTLGVDVSHHQEDPPKQQIDWNQVVDSGHVFAFQKATEGATFIDDSHNGNRAEAAAVGIPFGAYHFARPEGGSLAAAQADAISEAEHFLAVAQPAPGDLVPVLDLEANREGLGAKRLIAWTQAWLDTVAAAIDAQPLIYTNPNFWTTNMSDSTTFAVQGFPLWIAHYTSKPSPIVPASNWSGNGWSFWQWTSSAKVPGISGNVDENRYPGTDLSAFIIGGAPAPEPTPEPATAPSNESPPTISGDPEVGATLTAQRGTWGGTEPISYSFAWYRCTEDASSCSGILHQSTEPTYDLEAADLGSRMKVRVTATNSGGSSESDSAPTDVVTDTTAPTTPEMIEPAAPRTLAETFGVTWSEAEQGASYDVRYRRAPKRRGFGEFATFLDATSQTSATFDARSGSTYCFSARAKDPSDNASGWSAEACTNVPLDDRGLRAGSGWSRRSGANFFLGTFTKAKREGATLTVRDVRFKYIHVVAQKCSRCGRVKVLLNGRRVARRNLRSDRTINQKVIRVAGFGSIRRGTIKLVVISNGRPVKIDGLALTIKK